MELAPIWMDACSDGGVWGMVWKVCSRERAEADLEYVSEELNCLVKNSDKTISRREVSKFGYDSFFTENYAQRAH